MATETGETTTETFDPYSWATGLAAGLSSAILVGLVIQFGFDPEVLSGAIPGAFGLEGLTAGWLVFLVLGGVFGLVYAAIAGFDDVGQYATRPGAGASIGMFYGLGLWLAALVVVPLWTGAGVGGIGDYPLSLRGVLSFALLGLVIGLLYGVSPYTD